MIPRRHADALTARLEALEKKLLPDPPIVVEADRYLPPDEVESLARIVEQLPQPVEGERPDFTHVDEDILVELDGLLEKLGERCPAARSDNAWITYPGYSETSEQPENQDGETNSATVTESPEDQETRP